MTRRSELRYDTVFLDVDGTLLWMDLDIEGYVEDLSPYSANGPLTAERVYEPVWKGVRRHISQNIHYPTAEDLEEFQSENASRTARELELNVPAEILSEVAERRVSFNPYPESERVLQKLRDMGLKLYVVSNWDVLLEKVLEDLGWIGYFEAVVASAAVGVEKPGCGIFEEALRISGARPGRVVHVGNDPVADARGAAECGIDAVLVDRAGVEAPEAVATIPDLGLLPDFLGGKDV